MRSAIRTELERAEPVDAGVERRLEFSEEFEFNGELVERETTVQLLEDGGVAISQSLQGISDTLTLGAQVMQTLHAEHGDETDA